MTDSANYEQQSIIESTARRFLRENYSFEARRAIIENDPGYCIDQWNNMAQLGWMLLPISAQFGGLGGHATLVTTLAKEFGRAMYVSPFLTSAILSAKIIEAAAEEPLRSQLLESIGSGESIGSPAIYEPQLRYNLNNINTTAHCLEDRIVLNGTKSAILFGNVASFFLVLARHPQSPSNFALFMVPSDAAGVQLNHYRAHDGSRVSDLKLNDVELSKDSVLGCGQDPLLVVQSAVNFANAAICAELVGAMEFVLELTLDYVNVREQFGRTLSSFQALQHRLVDMYMRCQLAESMSREAARAMDSSSGVEQEKMICAAKCEIARAALLNAEEAVQIHGAMGMMDEMPVGHCLKRIFSLNLLFGDADYHQTRYRNLRLQQGT